jgi:hypothetical protein
MPPLWQYLWPEEKTRHSSPLLPPKGTDPGPLRLFPCKRPFLGVVRRGHHRHLGPPGKPTPWWWAKAMPPLWQYFALFARKSSRTSRLERDIWALISRGNRTHARPERRASGSLCRIEARPKSELLVPARVEEVARLAWERPARRATSRPAPSRLPPYRRPRRPVRLCSRSLRTP